LRDEIETFFKFVFKIKDKKKMCRIIVKERNKVHKIIKFIKAKEIYF